MAFHAALAFALMSASAAGSPPLQPTGKWVVAFEESMCLLQRSYGTGVDSLTLVFRQHPANSAAQLYLFESAPTKLSPDSSVMIGFGPGMLAVKTSLQTFFSPEKQLRTFRSGLTRMELQQAETSGQLTLDAGRTFSHKFAVSGLRQALAKLDECAADLLASWGVPHEVQARIVRFPEPLKNPAQPDDYPEDALRTGVSGEASAIVRVNSVGVASECKIVKSSGNRSLDRATCRVLTRGKYEPAIDNAGRPIEGLFATSIHWQVMDY